MFFNYIKDFINAFGSLSNNDKLILIVFALIFVFFFIRLLILNGKVRIFFLQYLKKFMFLTCITLAIYIVSDQSYCDTPITKTLFEKVFENKKIGAALFVSGVTIGTSVYLYKKYYPMVDPLLATVKKKETFLEIENNHSKLEISYNNYEKTQNLGYELCFIDYIPHIINNPRVNPNLIVFTPSLLKEMRDHTRQFLSHDSIMISNLKYLDSRKLDFEDMEALVLFQRHTSVQLNTLNLKTLENNQCYGWGDDDKIVESASIIENQVFLFETFSKYCVFLDHITSNLNISKGFNNILHKSEDILIVSGYCFFFITSIFTYGINPIPFDYFTRSFFRLFNYKYLL